MSEYWFSIFRNVAFFLATTMLVKYYIFLLLAPFYSVKETWRRLQLKRRGLLDYNPKISVIIPAWNEEVGVLKTIQSVVDNTYQNVEVVVINDGSTDNSDAITRAYVKAFEKANRGRKGIIRYFYQENGGKGKALNFGIQKATGDIILTVDADSALHPEALDKLRIYFADPSISAAVGNVKISKNPSLVGFLQSLEYQFGFYFKRSHAVMGAEYIFGGACAAFRSDVFSTYGLFDDVNKTEDIEMSMRLRFHGLKCAYAEDVVCYTEGASTVTGLVNQRLRWKKGRFDTFIKYRSMFFSFNKQHNKFLSWVVLPYALLAEVQLLLEPISVSLLLTYSVISEDYLSLALGMLFVFVIYLVNALFAGRPNIKLLLLFPLSWIMFYGLVWIEYLALVRSITMVFRGYEVQWQTWNRKGVAEVALSAPMRNTTKGARA
jgi:biofilm PGA synthesis N-glycosyltransferase PgaC